MAKKTENNKTNSSKKETKYCVLLDSVRMFDKESGYTYAFEKIHVKELNRDEIRLCLYKDMVDRSGDVKNRMLVRPVDLTELEFIHLFERAYTENLFSTEFKEYLKNIANNK